MSFGIGGSSLSASVVGALAAGGSGTHRLYAGWFNIQDVALNQCLFGWNTVNGGIYIDTATPTEISVKSQRATTIGVRVTSGAGLTTGKWYFIAVYVAQLSSAATDYSYVWVGAEDTPPVGLATTQSVAPAGSVSGSSTWVFGNNQTTGSAGLRGWFAWGCLINVLSTGSILSPLKVSSYLTPTASELEFIKNALLIPMWSGDHICKFANCGGASTSAIWSEIIVANFEAYDYTLTAARSLLHSTAGLSMLTVATNGPPPPTYERPARPLPVIPSAVAPRIYQGMF